MLGERINPRLQPDLTHVDLARRDLTGIDFRGVGLFEADLRGTCLVGANLRQCRLISTQLDNATLTGAKVWGASVWDVTLEGTIQTDLIITPKGADVVTVDDLGLAQFIYLLINNQNLRRVIDTITSKVVLILGRFTPDRKAVLELLKVELRKRGFVPVLFDFRGPDNRDFTETVSTLAHLSRFVVADLTDPACIPHELRTIVPEPQVPVVTLIARGNKPYAMFNDFLKKYPWVQAPFEYTDLSDLKDRIVSLLVTAAEDCRKKIFS